MKWYKSIGLNYARKNDLDFTNDEIRTLLKLYDIHKSNLIQPYKLDNCYIENVNLLKEKGIVYSGIENNINNIKFTEEGLTIVKNIHTRLNLFPELNSLRTYLKLTWEKSLKELSEKAGITYYTATHIIKGNSNRPIYLEDLESVFKVMGLNPAETIKIIKIYDLDQEKNKNSTWYREIGLEYAKRSDPMLTPSEIKVLMKFKNNNYSSDIPDSLIKNLVEKELIEIQESNEVSLSKKGISFMKDISDRLTFPELRLIVKCISKEMDKLNCSIKELSESSGIILNVLAGILKSWFRFNDFVYIDDLEKILISLNKDFYDIIDKNRKLPKKDNSVKNKETAPNKFPKKSVDNNYKILISESPIETKLLKEIIKLKETYEFDIDTQVDFSVNGRNYRAEIFIEFNTNGISRKILVECDGHDFHEKTKEQVQKDKQRDRDFLSAGIITLRFTGSEIWKNAKKCAEEIFNTYNGFQAKIN